MDGIDLGKQLSYPDVHEINDKLLDNDNAAEQDQHISFVSHGSPEYYHLNTARARRSTKLSVLVPSGSSS
jgi:hypothetical protein